MFQVGLKQVQLMKMIKIMVFRIFLIFYALHKTTDNKLYNFAKTRRKRNGILDF